MRKVLFLSILLVLMSCSNDTKSKNPTETDNSTDDFLIIPGKSVGRITARTTEAELQEMFGADKMKIQSIPIAEGDTQEGVVLYPNTPNEIEIIWETAASEGTPAFIRIGKDSTSWKTQEGITIGTPLEELEAINGTPFTFNGFEWDYGGLVTNWNGGKLTDNLIIAFVPQNFEVMSQTFVGDDVQLSSDDPKVRALQPRVGSMVITFNRKEAQ